MGKVGQKWSFVKNAEQKGKNVSTKKTSKSVKKNVSKKK